MLLEFEKIIPTQSQNDELFFLLKNRKHSISHTNMPSKKSTLDLFLRTHIVSGILYTITKV